MGLLSRFLRRTSHANRTRFVLACWFVILMLYALWASYLNTGSDDSVSYIVYLLLHDFFAPPTLLGAAVGHLLVPRKAHSEWWTWGPVAILAACSIALDALVLWTAGRQDWPEVVLFCLGVAYGHWGWRQRYISEKED